ncbi:hypothetical protein V2J09_021759 [Rumex salicifolius]
MRQTLTIFTSQKERKKMESPGTASSSSDSEKSPGSRSQSIKEKKTALIQDVEKLKKRLNQERNIHRALERAFNRPLGALPRLPPYLPANTQELLAEIAVLEEEVVRLEEQVVSYREGLYQEAIYISSKRKMELQSDLPEQFSSKNCKQEESKSRDNNGVNLATLLEVSPRSLARFSQTESADVFDQLQPPNSSSATIMSWKQASMDPNGGRDEKISLMKSLTRTPENSPRSQQENKTLGGDSEPNKISEDVLKCLCSIYMRMSTLTDKTPKIEIPPSLVLHSFKTERLPEFQDPYGCGDEFKDRDVGLYKHLSVIDAGSIDFKRKRNALFLIHKLKLLFGRLATVNLEGLSHYHKLAFWINTYNSCMMNAFLEHGLPENPETVMALMREATVEVGGHMLNALTIENFILRLPFYLQFVCPKDAKTVDLKERSAFGLEWSEPLVTFALSCGSWSSPAVRVYTASQVESELIAAKRDYLQSAIGISKAENKLIIPKLLDWYLLDFAKDLQSFVDWVCLQLPDQQRKEALEFLGRNERTPLTQLVQVMPYDFTFSFKITSQT